MVRLECLPTELAVLQPQEEWAHWVRSVLLAQRAHLTREESEPTERWAQTVRPVLPELRVPLARRAYLPTEQAAHLVRVGLQPSEESASKVR